MGELDAPLGVHERPRIFREARARQHDVDVPRCFREEQVLHRHEFDVLKPLLGVRDVRIGNNGILAHDVHAAHAALGLDDFREHEAALQRHRFRRHAPRRCEPRARACVRHGGIVDIREGDGPHVGGSLYVVMPAYGQHGGTPTSDHAAAEHQIEERRHDVGAVGMLRQAHRPQRAGVRPPRVRLRGALDLLGGHARDLGRLLRRVRLDGLTHAVEVARPLRDERLVFEALGQDVIQHRRIEGDVGAGLHLQVHVRAGRELGAARIGDDQLRALFVRALQRRAEHGVRLGRVRAGDEDDVAGLFDFPHRSGRGRGVDRALHGGDGRGVAEPGAVVDVVGAEGAAVHPHEHVVLFVGALGGREAGERVRPALGFDAQQLLRRQLHCLFPGGFAERRVPVGRRRDAVADVQVEPLEQRQLADFLSGRARRGAGLGSLALPLNRPPRTAASLSSGAALPDPATSLLGPAFSDQRLGEPIAMLREVVAEPAFHAGRALVRRVQLDVGRGDAQDFVVSDVQVDLHVADNKVLRVTSPDIELNTPNQGSTCVKGRFGYDFPQHRDRLTKPLIRKGWTKEAGRWVWKGGTGAERRGGPWRTIQGEGQRSKPGTPPRATGKKVRELPLLERLDQDIRDRVATPAEWYTPFREATWEEAMELTAQELLRIKAERGPNALACFSSAKCSNEENYLLMRMYRGALGTNNVDHCTRLCHSTSVAAMQRAINNAAASGSMREIEEACDVIFIAGANTTESHPVFGAALKRAHEKRAKLIVADPRRTELAARADVHLQMQPGTDVALYSAMLNHILAQGLEDKTFIAQRTRDFDRVHEAVKPYTPEKAAKITGVPAEKIKRAAETYARGPNTSTLWAMGLTQHANGTDIVTSLLNLMFGCGMIGRWGAAMLPVRGQNNVQGASDMGAVPFAYTDYAPVTDARARARFATTWGVPAESMSLEGGLMLTEIVKPESGVRGMYIMGENPIISDPDIAHAEQWFQNVEFMAVQDLFLTETARYADVVLPGSSFAEKTGTFVNTERRIQLSHQAVDSPGQARGDLDILIELSNRVGLPTTFKNAEDVMREIARVAPSWAGVTYERLEGAGLQYPVPTLESPGTAFLFDRSFPTDDGLVHFVAVAYTDPVELPDEQFPFVMNTGRQL